MCVLEGNAGVLFALPLLLLNFLLSPNKRADLQLSGLLLSAGVVIDGTLQFIGFISFTSSGYPIPLWLAVIWLALAALPHHSLAWMKRRRFLPILFGAVGGPLAYWSGVRLEAAIFHWPLLSSLLLLGMIWGLLWPAVMAVAVRQTSTQPEKSA